MKLFSLFALFICSVAFCQENVKLQVPKEKIHFSEGGMSLRVHNHFIPISRVAFDPVELAYYAESSELVSSGVCSNGHKWYPALGGCIILGCPWYYGKYDD